MALILDASKAPLFIATATGVLTDDEYRAHLEECTELLIKPKKPYAFVYDGTGIKKMASSQRGMQASWINEHRTAVAALNRGCGFAFDSALTRGLLTAVHWLSPPPYPHRIFPDRDGAIAWCRRRLIEAGDIREEISARG